MSDSPEWFGEFIVGFLICSLVGVSLLIASSGFNLVGFMYSQFLATVAAVVLLSYYLVSKEGSYKSLLLKSSVTCILMPSIVFGVYFLTVKFYGLAFALLNGVV